MTIDIRPWVKANQEKMMEFYLGINIGTKLIRSPFREDTKPTCGFYYGKTGTLYLHDFGTNEHFDVFEIVKKKFGLSYYKATKKILEDEENFKSDSKLVTREKINISYIGGSVNHTYFSTFYISPKTLEKFKVEEARIVYINEDLYWRGTENNPIFIYKNPSGRIKCYRPLAKDSTKKWKSTTSIEDIDGWNQLPPKGKIVFITSSRKDVMVLHEQGYPAISFPTEGIPSKGDSKKFVEEKIAELKDRFEHVFLFLDSDTPGIEYSKKISKVYKVDYITTPIGGPKDISDYIKKYGVRKTRSQLKKLIKNKFNERQQSFLDLAGSFSNSLRASGIPEL